MIASLLSYDVSWTAMLLRRDVRELQTKYTTKLQYKFAALKTTKSISPHEQSEPEATVVDPRGPQYISVFSDWSSDSSVCSELPQDGAPTTTSKGISTLYELLDSRLKDMDTYRDRNMSDEIRWKFRGSRLLLSMAIQACPSNDSYDIFRDGTAAPDDSLMLLGMLMRSTEKNRRLQAHEVSQMPADIYPKQNNIHGRYDSMFSNTAKPVPPHTAIWLDILEAVNDSTRTTSVAEDLLGYVWPEKKATDVLEQIGNPCMKFSDADADELRTKFRELLFPEYELL
ncbi:hypothetical protein EJ02DRAFT_366196, partial [Clathrospora elynae]